MKWGLFIIALGALTICLAGNPTQPLDLAMIGSGLFTIAIGSFVMFASAKMKKRREERETIEREAVEFEAEQQRKKLEAGKEKERANVEKSRKNSKENSNKESEKEN